MLGCLRQFKGSHFSEACPGESSPKLLPGGESLEPLKYIPRHWRPPDLLIVGCHTSRLCSSFMLAGNQIVTSCIVCGAITSTTCITKASTLRAIPKLRSPVPLTSPTMQVRLAIGGVVVWSNWRVGPAET